jgi:hypothetical protein
MPDPKDEPLHRTSLWLFWEDFLLMESIYGRGWTEIVRNLVHEHCNEYRRRHEHDR